MAEPTTTAAVIAAADVVANRKQYFSPISIFSSIAIIALVFFLALSPFHRQAVANGINSDGTTCTPTQTSLASALGSYGPFASKNQVVEDAAKTNNIDPVLLTSIILHETDGGKKMDKFPDVDKGIKETAGKYKGKTDFKGINTDITDPAKKQSWETGVGGYVSQLGGIHVSNCASGGVNQLPPNASGFQSPLKIPLVITSHMSTYREFQGRAHYGTDYDCVTGDELLAIKEGTVTKVANNAGGWGYYVIIDHGQVSSLYAHQMEMSKYVKEGQKVQRGQVIGKCGNTGNSFGDHLHLEIYNTNKNGRNYADYYDASTFLK